MYMLCISLITLISSVYSHGISTNTNITNVNTNIDENVNTINEGISSGTVIGLSFVCMFATIFGACLPFIIKRCMFKKLNMSSVSLFTAGSFGFASGAIIFGALFDILPNSIESLKSLDKYANLVGLSSMLLGIGLFIGLEKVVFLLDSSLSCPCHAAKNRCNCNDVSSCGCVESFAIKKVKGVSFMTFLAMTIHHIPEGIIFYLSLVTNLKSGVVIGILSFIHVIPEGFAIGISTLSGYPDDKWRVFVYSGIAGFAQPVGALIGYGIFSNTKPNDVGIGITFAATAGMLLTIAIRGFLPYARYTDKNDKVTSVMVLLGAIILFFSVAMFGLAGLSG